MKRFAFTLTVALLLVTAVGCGIKINSSTPAGKDGGVFKSMDFGEHWAQKVFVRQEPKKTVTISDVSVAQMIFSPRDPEEIMLLTTNAGIYKTTDGGETWAATKLVPGYYAAFVYDPVDPALFYAAAGNTILKSADSGETWGVIYTETSGQAIAALVVDKFDPKRIFAATSNGVILQSLNYGTDWTVLSSVNDTVKSLKANPSDSRIMYLVAATNGIMRTTDGGVTWKPLEKLSAVGASQIYQLTFSQRFPSTLFVGSNYGFIKSTDGGDTWVPIKTLIQYGTIPITTVGVDTFDLNVLYFTVNHLLHKTEDGGLTWRTIESVPTSRPVVQLANHPTKPGILYFGTLKPKK